jgi:hypothetical protein
MPDKRCTRCLIRTDIYRRNQGGSVAVGEMWHCMICQGAGGRLRNEVFAAPDPRLSQAHSGCKKERLRWHSPQPAKHEKCSGARVVVTHLSL